MWATHMYTYLPGQAEANIGKLPAESDLYLETNSLQLNNSKNMQQVIARLLYNTCILTEYYMPQ